MGKLKLTLVQGTSDPYARILLTGAGTQQSKRSSVIQKELNPYWGESFFFDVKDPKKEHIRINLWDRDTFTLDDFMGTVTISLDTLVKNEVRDKWYMLRNIKSGEIRVILQAIDFGLPPKGTTTPATQNIIQQERGKFEIPKLQRVNKEQISEKQWTIRGEWIDGYSSGALRAKNPQVGVVVSRPTKATITLLRTDKGEQMGMMFVVCRNDSGERLTNLDNLIVGQSEFLSAFKVEHTIKLNRGTYNIIPCLEKPGTIGKFTIRIDTNGIDAIEDLYQIDPMIVKSITGKWEGPTAGGYQSLRNPQYVLEVSKKARYVITVDRTDKGELEGLIFIIVRGARDKKRLLELRDGDLIHESAYVKTVHLSQAFTLDVATHPYYIIPSMTTKKSGSFKLSVECAEDFFQLSEAQNRGSVKKEGSYENELKDYKYEGSKFYKKNPVELIIQQCKKNGTMFVDPDFPPNDESVNKGTQGGENFKLKYDKWMRVGEFLSNPQLYENGIDPEDMIQGEIGNCWYCEAVAALAGRPELVQRLFYPQHYSPYGVYAIRHFDEGEWKYVVVDDYIPTRNGRAHFAHSQNSNEIWVMLLEKAFAKVFGSYRELVGRSPSVALQRLTGGKVEFIELKKVNQNDLWKQIQDHVKEKWIMGCSTAPASSGDTSNVIDKYGIVRNHAYTVIDAREVKNKHRLLKIRNTWGHGEWKGDWSDSSPLWTPELRKELKVVEEDDGTFWMSLQDFTKYYHAIYLCKILDDKFPVSTTISGKWDTQCDGFGSTKNPNIIVQVEKQTLAHIELHRTDSGQKMGIILFVCEPDVKEVKYIQEEHIVAETQYMLSNYTSVQVMLEPGSYVLIPCLQSPKVDGSFKVRILSETTLNISGEALTIE